MLLLLLISLASWTVIFKKRLTLSQARREANEFEDEFWSGIDLTVLYSRLNKKEEDAYGLEAIFLSGFQEFLRLRNQTHLDPEILVSGAQRAMLRSGVRTLLALPLLREQQTVGGLVVGRKRTEQFTAAEIELLQAFATQSALAIHNAQLFRELADQGRQLEQASRHKSQFLANMSHELRTPLNAILGYTELIADGIYGELPEKVHEVLERVSHNGRHLLGLINAVLDLSKIEAGQLTLVLGDYTMKELVYGAASAVESLAAEKQLALQVELSRDLPPGRGDRQRLGQVLLNLIGNAIKFTDQGEVKITVNATAELFEVAISDTGPGIAPADQARIFDEFQQVDDSSTRTKGGSGLGLAIARKIINLHGGEIGVESKVGAGSKFWFRLPVQVERQQEAA
jgi:signal transduction histidine kinase